MRIEDIHLDEDSGELSVIGIVAAFILLVIGCGVMVPREPVHQCSGHPVALGPVQVAMSTKCPEAHDGHPAR